MNTEQTVLQTVKLTFEGLVPTKFVPQGFFCKIFFACKDPDSHQSKLEFDIQPKSHIAFPTAVLPLLVNSLRQVVI